MGEDIKDNLIEMVNETEKQEIPANEKIPSEPIHERPDGKISFSLSVFVVI